MKKILPIFILIIFSNCQDQKIENNFNPQENQVLTVEEDFMLFLKNLKKILFFKNKELFFL